ncbi:MAG: hypothetical protein AAF658_11585, partial [Myxococcota bacterium]
LLPPFGLLFGCNGDKLLYQEDDVRPPETVTEPGSEAETGSGAGMMPGANDDENVPSPPSDDDPVEPPAPSPVDACPNDPALTIAPAPTVHVVFPAATSATNGDAITARGFASARCDTTITAMSVFSGDTEFPIAITPGAEVDWQIALNLVRNAANTVEIRATSSEGLVGSATFVLVQEPVRPIDLGEARALVIPPGSSIAYVADRERDGVVVVDLDTGMQTVLSSPNVGAGPNFERIEGGIALDAPRNQLLVVDRVLDALIAVDLTTGDRRIVSDNNNEGIGIETPVAVTVDSDGGVAYYVDIHGSVDGVVAVDLETGNRTTVSNALVPADPQPVEFSIPFGIAIDAAKGRLLVVDSSVDELISVDLTDGSRSIVEQSTTAVPLDLPRGVVLDGERALIPDARLDQIIAIDLRAGPTYGDRTLISGDALGDGHRFRYPHSVAVDSRSGNLVVADESYRTLFSVSTADDTLGDRTLIVPTAEKPIGEGPRFTDPTGVVLDPSRAVLYLSDTGSSSVIALDVVTGQRRLVASVEGVIARGLGFDPNAGLFFIPNHADNNLLSISLSEGALAVVSDDDSPAPPLGGFGFPRGKVALEDGGDTVLVVDPQKFAVFRVEVATGTRSYFKRSGDLLDAATVIVDESRGRAMVSMASRQNNDDWANVTAYDLSTAESTILASTSMD